MIDADHAEFIEEELAKLAHPENGEETAVQAIALGLLLIAYRLQKPDPVKSFFSFAARHVAEKGEVSAEEMYALYKEFMNGPSGEGTGER